MSYPFQKDKDGYCQRCDDGWYPAKECSTDCDFMKFYKIAEALVKSQPNRFIRSDGLNSEIIITTRELATLYRENCVK